MLPALCQKLDLLSMMKRTRHHEKQNLEHLFDVEFSGEDTAGLVKEVTGFFAKRNGSISAFRQRTFKAKDNGNETMRCKFVVNMPEAENFETMEVEVGSQTALDITMTEGVNLQEVVVAAHVAPAAVLGRALAVLLQATMLPRTSSLSFASLVTSQNLCQHSDLRHI